MGFLTSWQSTAIAAGLAVVMFWLFMGAREDLAEERQACNTEHLQAALDAEIAVRRTQEAAHAVELAQLERIAESQKKALSRAAETAQMADSTLAEHEKTIEQLQLEVEADEIPDSRACLNAYVPRGAVQWLCRQGEDSDPDGASGGAGAGQACSNTGGFDTANLINSDFAAITYGGVISRWGADRRNIVEANGRLAEIRQLEGELIDE